MCARTQSQTKQFCQQSVGIFHSVNMCWAVEHAQTDTHTHASTHTHTLSASLFSFNKKCEKYPGALFLNYFYITSWLHKYYIGSLSAAYNAPSPATYCMGYICGTLSSSCRPGAAQKLSRYIMTQCNPYLSITGLIWPLWTNAEEGLRAAAGRGNWFPNHS